MTFNYIKMSHYLEKKNEKNEKHPNISRLFGYKGMDAFLSIFPLFMLSTK
jgi:hypothetical protein